VGRLLGNNAKHIVEQQSKPIESQTYSCCKNDQERREGLFLFLRILGIKGNSGILLESNIDAYEYIL
jgi:hypothetical protein